MSDICIYLKAEPYLAAFLVTAYGDPVELKRDSPESRIIREYISKTPDGVTPPDFITGTPYKFSQKF